MQLKKAIVEHFDEYFIDLIKSNCTDVFLKSINELSESKDLLSKTVSFGAKFVYKKVISGLSLFDSERQVELVEKRICTAYNRTIEYISTIIDEEELILLHIICQNANDPIVSFIKSSAIGFVNEHAIGDFRRSLYFGRFSKVGQSLDGILHNDDMRMINLAKEVRKALLSQME